MTTPPDDTTELPDPPPVRATAAAAEAIAAAPRVITNTARFGLTQWSADSDSPITRTQMNSDFGKIEQNALRGSNGTLAARPPAGIRDRLYMVSSGEGVGATYWDSGTAWLQIQPQKVLRNAHTFSVMGELAVSSADFLIPGFFMPNYSAQVNKVIAMRGWIASGTSVTIDLRHSGTTIPGLGGMVITSTASTVNLATEAMYTLPHGAYVSPHITAVSGTPKHLSLSVYIDSYI